MNILRAVTVVGSLYALMRNRLGLAVGTPLLEQEISVTAAPDRRMVVSTHEPVAGFAQYHGEVADAAALIALHTFGGTTLVTHPRCVQPGDTARRADRPGYLQLCIAGHGTAAADWAELPLSSVIAALVTDMAEALSAKQDASATLTALAALTTTETGRGLLTVANLGALRTLLSLGIAEISGLTGALNGKWGTPANAAVLAELADASGVLTYKGAGLGGAGITVAADGPPVAAYTYASPGDAHGYIYAIATLFGGRAWQAPGVSAFAATGEVGCLRSSEYIGSALLSVDRSAGVNVHTQSAAGSWQAWDLGAGNEFRPTGYTVRNRGLWGGIAIRNWKLQGTNNIASWTVGAVDAATWTDIDTRTGDTTMANNADAWAYYACAQPAVGYRYLRIVLTGTDADGSYYLAVGEVEFYGAAGAVPQLPDWADVWLTDGADHYWPAVTAG